VDGLIRPRPVAASESLTAEDHCNITAQPTQGPSRWELPLDDDRAETRMAGIPVPYADESETPFARRRHVLGPFHPGRWATIELSQSSPAPSLPAQDFGHDYRVGQDGSIEILHPTGWSCKPGGAPSSTPVTPLSICDHYVEPPEMISR
jgi:hypothetical protein